MFVAHVSDQVRQSLLSSFPSADPSTQYSQARCRHILARTIHEAAEPAQTQRRKSATWNTWEICRLQAFKLGLTKACYSCE